MVRQGMLAAVFVLAATAAQAQEVVTATLVTVNQSQRDPETFTTSAVPRTQLPINAGEYFRIRLTMSLSDVQNTANRWRLELYEFIPGTGWKFVTGGPVQGGVRINPETGQQIFPDLVFHPGDFNGLATDVRAELSWNQRQRIGAVLETFREE